MLPSLSAKETGKVMFRLQAITQSPDFRHSSAGSGLPVTLTANCTDSDSTVTILPLRMSRCSYLLAGEMIKKTSK